VYHRDLKDENVVIDQNLNVKLIDFGSAVCEDTRLEPKRYTEFKGTDAYAAPGKSYRSRLSGDMTDKIEIYPKGKARYEAAPTDIWALGLLLSMILTRSMPFTEGDRKYRFQLRAQVPDPAYEIIRACLRIDPRERPTIDEIASHYWLSEEYIRDLARRR
jgi:serine/threonine protein kinase